MTTLGALAAFPLRIEWDMLHPPVAEPFPAPVATTQDGHVPPAQPGPVRELVAAVESDGWATLVQHSAGHVPHATHGRPGPAPVEHWAVRMHRGHRGALAMRKGAAWEFFYVWSADGFGRATTVAHFRDILRFGPWLPATVHGPADCPWLVKWHGPMPSAADRRWGAVV